MTAPIYALASGLSIVELCVDTFSVLCLIQLMHNSILRLFLNAQLMLLAEIVLYL